MKNDELLIDLFDTWWSIWPSGQKQAKKEALKAWHRVFLKDPGIPKDDWASFGEDVLIDAIRRQVGFRDVVYRKYPDPAERKRHEIFIPRLCMPATWLNQGRWQDPVQSLDVVENRKPIVQSRCADCASDAVIKVKEQSFCAWHYTRRFNKDHLRILAAKLNEIGLGRIESESAESWAERCREHLRTTKWAGPLGA